MVPMSPCPTKNVPLSDKCPLVRQKMSPCPTKCPLVRQETVMVSWEIVYHLYKSILHTYNCTVHLHLLTGVIFWLNYLSEEHLIPLIPRAKLRDSYAPLFRFVVYRQFQATYFYQNIASHTGGKQERAEGPIRSEFYWKPFFLSLSKLLEIGTP